MAKVTINQKEYKELADKTMRYDYLKEIIENKENFFSPPPTKDPEEVKKAFKKTKKYNSKFIKGLEKSMSRSSHFNKK